jgi:uncharacterized protein (DUF697 family)
VLGAVTRHGASLRRLFNKLAGSRNEVSRWWQDRWAKRFGLNGESTLPSAGFGLGALLGALDWDSVKSEVDRECRARIVIAGAADSGKTTLLNRLRGLDVTVAPEPSSNGPASDAANWMAEDLGLFSVVPIAAPVSAAAPSTEKGGLGGLDEPTLQHADLIVCLLDGAAGLRNWEHEWLSRLRATGRPLLVVLNKCDQVKHAEDLTRIGRVLAQPVIPISALRGTHVVEKLLPSLVDACPNLTIALGREVPAWRHSATQRAMQRASALSGLAGLEPVPLLDIPFQVLIQLRLVLRIAAMYGEPVGDRYSRELVATLVSSAGLRYVAQQIAKVVPLLGWAVSGALAGAGTWAIGRIAQTYFENGRKLSKPEIRLVKRSQSSPKHPSTESLDHAEDGVNDVGPDNQNGKHVGPELHSTVEEIAHE